MYSEKVFLVKTDPSGSATFLNYPNSPSAEAVSSVPYILLAEFSAIVVHVVGTQGEKATLF